MRLASPPQMSLFRHSPLRQAAAMPPNARRSRDRSDRFSSPGAPGRRKAGAYTPATPNESAPTTGALPNFNHQTLTQRFWPPCPQGGVRPQRLHRVNSWRSLWVSPGPSSPQGPPARGRPAEARSPWSRVSWPAFDDNKRSLLALANLDEAYGKLLRLPLSELARTGYSVCPRGSVCSRMSPR